MSIVRFLRDRQADTLVGNKALPSQSMLLQSLGFPGAHVSLQNEQHAVSKNNVGPLKSGGREGIRTPDLLIANSGENKLRHSATIT